MPVLMNSDRSVLKATYVAFKSTAAPTTLANATGRAMDKANLVRNDRLQTGKSIRYARPQVHPQAARRSLTLSGRPLNSLSRRCFRFSRQRLRSWLLCRAISLPLPRGLWLPCVEINLKEGIDDARVA